MDLLVPLFLQMWRQRFDLHSVDLDPVAVSSYECSVIVTDHDALDCDQLLENSKLIIDAGGRHRKSASNIIRA